MTPSEPSTLRIGACHLDARTGRLTRGDDTVRLEPRMLRLLLCLAERPGTLVSADDVAHRVWPGTIVTPDSVYQAIASLRRVLGDDPKAPTYVVTEPRRGYRLIAPVSASDAGDEGSAATLEAAVEGPIAPASAGAAGGVALQEGAADVAAPNASGMQPEFRFERRVTLDRRRWVMLSVVGLLVVLALVGSVRRYFVADPPAPRSLAVMPFLDLTDSMGEEPFADGMTEELIGRLSKAGLRVPAPTAVFYYKEHQLPVAQIAAQLGVRYLLDGSVRKSGERLRIAARLMRADDGFVLWSETYERPRDDLLRVQDEIATAVAAALPAKLD